MAYALDGEMSLTQASLESLPVTMLVKNADMGVLAWNGFCNKRKLHWCIFQPLCTSALKGSKRTKWCCYLYK